MEIKEFDELIKEVQKKMRTSQNNFKAIPVSKEEESVDAPAWFVSIMNLSSDIKHSLKDLLGSDTEERIRNGVDGKDLLIEKGFNADYISRYMQIGESLAKLGAEIYNFLHTERVAGRDIHYKAGSNKIKFIVHDHSNHGIEELLKKLRGE